MSSWLPEPPVSFSLLPRRMGRGRGKGSAWTPGFSGYRASWYTSVSGCVVRASMCAHFVHVWAGEGSDSPLEWGTGAAALRMRGECVCLHVSVCVRGQTRLHLLARSRLLSLSLPSPPLSLSHSPALTHTHTHNFQSLLPFLIPSLFSQLLSPRFPLSPSPTNPACACSSGWGLSLPLWGCLGEHPRFSFPLDHSLPSWVELSRARRLLCATSSLEEGSGERRTPALCP